MNPYIPRIIRNNIAILISSSCRHRQNTDVVCLHGVKVKRNDFGVSSPGSILTRSIEKNASPEKFFLKATVGK